MNYYLVTISISKDEYMSDFKRHYYVCKDLKTAIKCANHQAYIHDFKSIDNKWKGVVDITQYYDKGWISIEKKQMWENTWD